MCNTRCMVIDRVHGGCDRSTEMLTHPRHLIKPPVYARVRVCPTLNCVFFIGVLRLGTASYLHLLIRLS